MTFSYTHGDWLIFIVFFCLLSAFAINKVISEGIKKNFVGVVLLLGIVSCVIVPNLLYARVTVTKEQIVEKMYVSPITPIGKHISLHDLDEVTIFPKSGRDSEETWLMQYKNGNRDSVVVGSIWRDNSAEIQRYLESNGIEVEHWSM